MYYMYVYMYFFVCLFLFTFSGIANTSFFLIDRDYKECIIDL